MESVNKIGQEAYLKTLLQLSQTLNSSLNVKQVIDTAVEQVVNFVGAERGFIMLVDANSRKVWGQSVKGFTHAELEQALSGKDPGSVPIISKSIIEKTLNEGKAILSMDAMSDPRFSQRESIQLTHVRSVLCVPIIKMPHQNCISEQACTFCAFYHSGDCFLSHSSTLGIIYLDNRVQTGIFDENVLEILTAFASQAATAIENAHLYESLKQSIEEQNRLQDQLHEQEARRMALEEATKMKNDFIGFISHELRNPLTSIRGFIQTLAVSEGSDIDDKDRKEFYEIIESEADRMMTLLNDLLDSSILEAKRPLKLNLAPMDIRPLIVKIVRSVQFSKYWTEAHRVEMNIAENIPEMTADQDRLTQVFLNLLSNAVKYSPEGGLIQVNACKDSNIIIVSIKDTGLGMTAEQMTRLFEKYERIDREDIQRIPGSGLGLFLTKKLVELHGGSITCESMQGKGSTFTVCLPIHSPLTT